MTFSIVFEPMKMFRLACDFHDVWARDTYLVFVLIIFTIRVQHMQIKNLSREFRFWLAKYSLREKP